MDLARDALGELTEGGDACRSLPIGIGIGFVAVLMLPLIDGTVADKRAPRRRAWRSGQAVRRCQPVEAPDGWAARLWARQGAEGYHRAAATPALIASVRCDRLISTAMTLGAPGASAASTISRFSAVGHER